MSTQKVQILNALRETRGGVCLADLPTHLNYTLRNRISELRSEGWMIESLPCKIHRHASSVRRYRLTTPTQGVLL